MEDDTNRQNVVKKQKNEATSERLKKKEKTQQAAVVVQGINAVLGDYSRFVGKIQTAVKTVSELAVITSWALNHHILHCFQHQKNTPVINQSLCYTAMASCCGSTTAGQKTRDYLSKKGTVIMVHEHFRDVRFAKPKTIVCADIPQSMGYSIVQMAVMEQRC